MLLDVLQNTLKESVFENAEIRKFQKINLGLYEKVIVIVIVSSMWQFCWKKCHILNKVMRRRAIDWTSNKIDPVLQYYKKNCLV